MCEKYEKGKILLYVTLKTTKIRTKAAAPANIFACLVFFFKNGIYFYLIEK